jgi:hypothetical protein
MMKLTPEEIGRERNEGNEVLMSQCWLAPSSLNVPQHEEQILAQKNVGWAEVGFLLFLFLRVIVSWH